jgi:alcohol dehydrogenase class IV
MQRQPGTTVIALGGGSTLDLAKAVRYRLADAALCALPNDEANMTPTAKVFFSSF